jgi:glycosyltransferase involved in cell wall biosynthesis
MKKILFIADGSLSNPILQSQGLPQLLLNTDSECQPFIMSFENPLSLSENLSDQKRYDETKALLGTKIIHVKVIVPFSNSKFNFKILKVIRFVLMIFKGVLATIHLTYNERISVVHCRSSYPTIIGVVAKLFTGVKVIYDNRGIPSEELKGRSLNIIPFFYKRIESILLYLSDEIVVVSKPFKEFLLMSHKFKHLDKKITIIVNGFSAERISYSDELRRTRREEENLQDKVVMVYSGTLSKWQMFEQICDVFLCLKAIEPRAFFLVLSPDSDRVREIFINLNLLETDYRIFNITNNELGKYLIVGDFGTLFREEILLNKVSSPIKFAEYLASGLPVLLTKSIGDTEDICRRNGIGVVIEDMQKDIGSALIKIRNLVNQEGVHQKCSDVACRELSVISAAKKYRTIYFN